MNRMGKKRQINTESGGVDDPPPLRPPVVRMSGHQYIHLAQALAGEEAYVSCALAPLLECQPMGERQLRGQFTSGD